MFSATESTFFFSVLFIMKLRLNIRMLPFWKEIFDNDGSLSVLNKL